MRERKRCQAISSMLGHKKQSEMEFSTLLMDCNQPVDAGWGLEPPRVTPTMPRWWKMLQDAPQSCMTLGYHLESSCCSGPMPHTIGTSPNKHREPLSLGVSTRKTHNTHKTHTQHTTRKLVFRCWNPSWRGSRFLLAKHTKHTNTHNTQLVNLFYLLKHLMTGLPAFTCK